MMLPLLGGLLATFILFFFLKDVRSTLMIGLSIPVSVMATFALMYQTDLTLNIMSLGGIALGIGMLVDNSIVVLEAIERVNRELGTTTAVITHNAIISDMAARLPIRTVRRSTRSRSWRTHDPPAPARSQS